MKITPLRVIPKIKSKPHLIDRCEDYLNNKWYTSARYGKDIYIPFNEIWTYSGPDRSWRFQHHSLASVSHLIDGYIETGDKRYLNLSKKLILNWYEVNFPTSPSDMGWHDHSTAWRLINICRFYVEWKETKEFNKDEIQIVSNIVQSHCEKLADPVFYMPKHNHGLDQDMALFTASVLFNSVSSSKDWERLSIERFEKQLDHLFGLDGSYLEHSPHYVYLLLKNLYSFLDFICQINHPFADILVEKFEKTVKYLVYVLQPNGLIPSIGDSENFSISTTSIKNWKMKSEDLKLFLEQLLSNSFEANHDVELPLDAAFLDAGVVSLRNQWEFDDYTTQIIMYSGFHSRVHKHYDDLSFVLFNKGMPLITEGGKYNYDYKAKEREYIVSPFAHNSVMIDGKPADISRKNIEKSGILSYLLTKNISYVSGMHALYPNINHRRIFVYFKPDILVVIDKIDGIKNHTYDTFFNLHWDLDCIEESDSFNGYLNGEKVIKISEIFSVNGNMRKSISKGEQSPLKGWLSPEYSKFVPNPLIQYRCEGTKARNIYQISLGKSLDNEERVQTSWEGDNIQLTWKSYKVDIQLTDFYEHIYIKDKYYRTEKVIKPELMEGITLNEAKQYQNASMKPEAEPKDKNTFFFNPSQEIKVKDEVRLVFFDMQKKIFSRMEIIPPNGQIEIPRNEFDQHLQYKYKYQIKKESKWRDVDSYKYLPLEEVSDDGLKYKYYHVENSPFLTVIFQALNEKPSYNYIGRLAHIPISRLYIKDDYGYNPTKATYYLGENKSFDIAFKVQKLIEEKRMINGIDKTKVICAGSSKGGYAAIFHAIKGEYGQCVAGGPQIYLGEYLGKNLKNTSSVLTPIYKYLTGNLYEEDKEWLNSILIDLLELKVKENSKLPDMFIHVGKGEPHYDNHILPFLDTLKSKGIENIFLNLGDYDSHKELAKYFPVYLERMISEIIKPN